MNNSLLKEHNNKVFDGMRERALADLNLITVQTKQAKILFLSAWKSGVNEIGGEYFNQIKPLKVIQDKDDLQPDHDYVNKNIWILSPDEQILLAVMCSFFDPEWGGDLMKQAGLNGFADISGSLSHNQNEIVAALLINYRGW